MSRFILAAGGYESSVRLYDAVENSLICSLQFPDAQVLLLRFSGRGASAPNERLLLAIAGSPKICLYDVSPSPAPPNPFFVYALHTSAITSVGFEPENSKFLYSSSEDGTLQVWVPCDPSTWAGHQSQAVTLNPHGFPEFLPQNGRATVHNRLRKFSNYSPGNRVSLVAINDAVLYPPKLLYFTVDAIGRLRIWDHRNNCLHSERVPHPSRRHLQCIELSSNYEIVALSNLDGLVFVYRVQDLLKKNVQPVSSIFRASDTYITRVRLSENVKLLVCTLKSSGVRVFRMSDILARSSQDVTDDSDDALSIAPVRQLGARTPGWIWDAAFVGSTDEYLFTCSSNTQLMLWDLRNIPTSREFPQDTHASKALVCLAVKEQLAHYPGAVDGNLDHIPQDEHLANGQAA